VRVLDTIIRDLDDPSTVVGAVAIGLLFVLLAMIAARLIGRAERRIEARVTDVTGHNTLQPM
jgi:hypothetical protein